MNKGNLIRRARPIRRQWWTWETLEKDPDQWEGKDEHGRLVEKRPTNKKARTNMGDL